MLAITHQCIMVSTSVNTVYKKNSTVYFVLDISNSLRLMFWFDV